MDKRPNRYRNAVVAHIVGAGPGLGAALGVEW